MNPTSPIDDLRKEHQRLLADIKSLQDAVRESANQATETGRDRMEMFQHALEIHIRREEEGLFPDARQMVARSSKRPAVLSSFFGSEAEEDIDAHRVLAERTQQLLDLIEGISQAVKPDAPSLARFRALLDLTGGLLERHADKEDKLIFPMIERSLDAAQLEQVGERMHALGSADDLTDSTEGGMRQIGG
jgi:hemerythrin-like domain-containing protein